jgi:hypothetical protein
VVFLEVVARWVPGRLVDVARPPAAMVLPIAVTANLSAGCPWVQNARPRNSVLVLDPTISRCCAQRSCRLDQTRQRVFDCDYGARVEPT